VASVWVLFVVLMVVAVAVGFYVEKKRREKLAAYAASRGWTYTRSDDSLVHRFSGHPFGQGHGRSADHVVRGTHDGRPMIAFDYSYKETSGTGKDRKTSTYHYSVVAVHLGTPMPALSVTPEGMVGRMFGRLTNTDLELESEDFNRAFTVRSPDRKFAFDVLHPQMMETLLQWPERGWRFDGDSMLVVSRGRQQPEEIDAKLVMMDAVVDQVPEFVWRQLRGGQSS